MPTEEYFIHYADPGFAEPPWPGQRRQGPYLTVDEAFNQAVSDGAGGQAEALGIFTSSQSDELANNPDADVTPEKTAEEISTAAHTLREELVVESAHVADSDRQAIEDLLPSGVKLEDLENAGLLVSRVGGAG